MDTIFQPLAVRVHKGCDQYIKKVLTYDKLYFLCNHYAEDPNNPFNLIQYKAPSMMESVLYKKKRQGLPPINITVNAIVGKNGEGKSALIEIILRVINNFAYNNGFCKSQHSLAPVEGLFATIFYRIGVDIFAIYCQGQKCQLFKNGVEVDNLFNDMFYTIVINYSLYAYNSRLLDRESVGYGSWIDGLFHKNDEYQTPIVINPMRKMGNIDVNRETTLSRQRLMAMYVKSESEIHRRISENQFADGFAYSLENESKLYTHLIRDYFKSVQGEYITWTAVEQTDGSINKNMLTYMKSGWDACCDCLYDYLPLLGLLSSFAEEKNIVTNPKNTDLYKYLSYYAQIANSSIGNSIIIIEHFVDGSYGWLNFRQFYRLLVIAIVWDELKYVCIERGTLLSTVINSCETVLKTRHKNSLSAAWLYMVYKVISIMETYPEYNDVDTLYTSSYDIFIDKTNVDELRKRIGRIIVRIMNDTDYVSLKFHQAMNFIEQTNSMYNDPNLLDKKVFDYDYYMKFDNMRRCLTFKSSGSLSDILPLLPPPIFQGDIIISDNNNEKVELQALSSGEIQRLYSVSSVIYHLRNLDDRMYDQNRLTYNRVYVILEEVELYFHPEYQQSYLEYLLNQIEFAGLRHIDSIGITMVTHSPFILSDMLPDNLCCMYKKSHSQPTQTFGANIADLLKDSFFLEESFMGLFVKNKIKGLLKYLQRNDNVNDSDWDDKLAESFIENLNEPLLKQLLMSMYVQKTCGNDKYSMKQWYRNKLKSL